MDKQFTRDELVNVLRGWHKMFTHMSKGHERNVRALAEAADLKATARCVTCKNYNLSVVDEPCNICTAVVSTNKRCWQWRGVCEENSKEGSEK